MQPTLNTNIKDPNINGDTIYINTVSDYHANDIVVAEVSWWSKGPIIKRIVGCPGDKVEIRDLDNSYGLFVNETLLYTKDKTIVSNHGSLGGTNMHYRQYLNFLNNPSNQDNVGINSLGEKCIVLNDDEYMLVGDNWGESTDCLYHSPVKSSDIVGKVELIIPYENENNFSTLFSFMMRKVFC